MNIGKLFYRGKINIAKIVMLGCIFLLCFLFTSVKVDAITFDILSSTYTGNGKNENAVTIDFTTTTGSGDDAITTTTSVDYIQGTGISNKDGIKFKMENMYASIDDINSIAVWESFFSESSAYKDYDRWYIDYVICDSFASCGSAWDEQIGYGLLVKYVDSDRAQDAGSEYVYLDVEDATTGELRRYFVEASPSNVNMSGSEGVSTVANFDYYFSDKYVTYTYRIRNANYKNRTDKDGFGYKDIEINLWRASDGEDDDINYATETIRFGLAKAISDAEVYTNYNKTGHYYVDESDNNPIDCSADDIRDSICIDYVDTNGDPEYSTTVPDETNIYLPDNILYEHKYTTRAAVETAYMKTIDDGNGGTTTVIDLDKVHRDNTLYAYNYFCEGDSITIADISYDNGDFPTHRASCQVAGDGTTPALRKYLYVEALNDDDTILNQSNVTGAELRTSFRDSQYKVTITVDSRGAYVFVIRDMFGNISEKAIAKVIDIINQTLIAYFEKSNKTTTPIVVADGWQADEYLTNEDVLVTITMSATTVIEEGLPILAAQTTLLDSSYIETIYYWRVDTNITYVGKNGNVTYDNFDQDVCGEGEKDGCALIPAYTRDYTVLYNKPQGGNASTHSSYKGFDGNRIKVSISGNGRYRFYIKTYAGNSTNDSTTEGEKKNPRVEIYKIDKNAPEILFGVNDANCNGTCKYREDTYIYYQGSGKPSGSLINNLAQEGAADYTITYNKSENTINGIYYPTANDQDSLLGSAGVDVFYNYIHAMFNSGLNINENLAYYNTTQDDIAGSEDNDSYRQYAYFKATGNANADNVEYKLVFNTLKGFVPDEDAINGIKESAYREYIIKNNIMHTAYALSSNMDVTLRNTLVKVNGVTKEGLPEDVSFNRIKIEFLDGVTTNKTVCQGLSTLAIDFNDDDLLTQQECVNYYLDHGIDFKIKITAYDVVQSLADGSKGQYILGNVSEKTIDVDVVDTTAPGFSKEIVNYNVGSECRMEIGSSLGKGLQNKADLLNCYGIVTDDSYNIEDNVFSPLYSTNPVVNTDNHINIYVLSRETGLWVNINDGYIPNRSGKYALLVVIFDKNTIVGNTTFDLRGNTYEGVKVEAGSNDKPNVVSVQGNAIATLVSYYVDKRIVLISPESGVYKDYGNSDPLFNYTVYTNLETDDDEISLKEYLEAPFASMDEFDVIGTTTLNEDGDAVSLTDEELTRLLGYNFSENATNFTGVLTRQQSALYNKTKVNHGNVDNNYVGEYKIVLGTLTISGTDKITNDDIGSDYIIKIDPRVRNTEHQLKTIEGGHILSGTKKCNEVNSYKKADGSIVSGCYGFKEDDDFFVESNVIYTIRQVILTVSASGSNKVYGDRDTNYNNYNNNFATGTVSSIIKGDSGNAYIGGYSVSGLKYSDKIDVVLGVLRREVGENVGVYAICNYRGKDLEDTELEEYNNMLIVGNNSTGVYQSCSKYDEYAQTVVNTGEYDKGILVIDEGFIASRSLYIKPNYANGFTHTLNALETESSVNRNNSYANYVINYNEGIFTINPATMVVQPAPGQRREYNYSGVDEVDPWEVIVYGTKTFSKAVEDNDGNIEFNGWSEDSPTYSAQENDTQSRDYGSAASGSEHYNNASEDRATWKLIHSDGVTYTGFKTNETHSIFTSGSRIGLTNLPEGVELNNGRYLNMNAGWYEYSVNTLNVAVNTRNQCKAVNVPGRYDSDDEDLTFCKNYNMTMDYQYRDENGNKNGDTKGGSVVDVVYKSKGKYCRGSENVADMGVQCDEAVSSKILFEVYRREIILEFNSLLEKIPSNDKDIVYGNRYDYYYTNLFKIANDSANKDYLEGSEDKANALFYCYASYGEGIVGAVYGECSSNKWYGLTEGDSWVNVGLAFALHSQVSDPSSAYYDSDSDKAIPAGRYYVYASISATNNYNLTYLGGTLTIKTKTVSTELSSYDKEYGNVYYNNVTCLKDGSFLSGDDSLISDCEGVEGSTGNTDTNRYGFVIPELDSKDTIDGNFIGRPLRDSQLANGSLDVNGLQENVGVYPIRVGTIHASSTNPFAARYSCDDQFLSDKATCVVVSSVSINNYMMSNDLELNYQLTYYLRKNATNKDDIDYSTTDVESIVGDRTINTAKLTIKPATITITVTPNQTKMYGCSYNSVNVVSQYNYSYSNGYDCVEGNAQTNYDFGYEYKVVGDKDYYIYVNGYYTSNFASIDGASSYSYTTNSINQISESETTLVPNGSKAIGLRSSALNGGVLYRVLKENYSEVSYAQLISAADNAQSLEYFQGQKVGSYYITLGNLNATLTSKLTNHAAVYNNVCSASNVPGEGSEICRNYIIDYYGNTSVDETHDYSDLTDLEYTITPRVAFIHTDYNSKVYGNNDPVITKTCTSAMVTNKICASEGETVTYGLSVYTTKANSLAKAPWVASIETGSGISFAGNIINEDLRDDVQTDVVSGSLTRYGMAANEYVANKDDIVGTYNYLFTNVVLTNNYGEENYVLNYHYRKFVDTDTIIIKNGSVDEDSNELILDTNKNNQPQAVNSSGGNTITVEGVVKNMIFEINLRKITVTLISFDKVYGIEDNDLYYDLGICATGDEILGYDSKGNPICSYKEGVSSTEHGLSPTHLSSYTKTIEDGEDSYLTLKQTEFKQAFGVTFIRALGENVNSVVDDGTCAQVTGSINGYFADVNLNDTLPYASTYSYSLGCSGSAYESLGVIDQSENTKPGYNYQITYVVGTMNIIPRQIEITPDSNQGFQYGSYMYPTLIPAIKFSDSLDSVEYINSNKKTIAYKIGAEKTEVVIVDRLGNETKTNIETIELGLVNGKEDGKVCLTNIDKTNSFCINDRKDTYDSGDSEKTTSSFVMNKNGSSEVAPTYVFGDVYEDEDSTRHALNRVLGTNIDSRYNRNVGKYQIVRGDLVDSDGIDLSGNYKINFVSGVEYEITFAVVNVTPIALQSKIYGEADKELKFSVVTTYTVNTSQYMPYDADRILSVVNAQGEEVTLEADANDNIKLDSGSTVTLKGFAYYENMDNDDYNYGLMKNSNKEDSLTDDSAITQLSTKVGKSYDKYCYDNYEDNSDARKGVIEGCNNRNITYSTTTRILTGYLYVSGYNQKANTHLIANGLVVSNNEFNQNNYDLYVDESVTFEIIKLDINLIIKDVTKIYGEATDSYKCETGISCSVNEGILTSYDHENSLEYNFDISYTGGGSAITPSASTDMGDSSKVLMVKAINGNYYTQSEGEEDKNNFLGISVIREVNNDTECSVNSDEFGCEDAGSYTLVFRKVVVTGENKDGSSIYDNNYNLQVGGVNVVKSTVSSDAYVVVKNNHLTIDNAAEIDVIEVEENIVSGTLKIENRLVDIFVNTNLNETAVNNYQIEQNIVPPALPTIKNDYDLKEYNYDPNKQYHGVGENASSSSANIDLSSTYGRIVWGDKPKQVRTSDALIGAVAYCNEPTNGNLYSDTYPDKNVSCGDSANLKYDGQMVNTNTKNKFIFITRDANSNVGLKIMPNADSSNVANNNYENKNYTVTFYAGAVNVVEDNGIPTLVIGNKDYYIEANASKDNGNIVGTVSSIGTILEYLFNGSDTYYVLASVDDNGNLYIEVDGTKIAITQSSLLSTYGVNNNDETNPYPGIVSGVEQTKILPFVSDYARVQGGGASYLNETNIKTLQELITTLIKWFDVSSYDNGQIVNNQILDRRFDKYYYVAINKYGYNIAGGIDNTFAINKVGTYNLSFYVMDNAGNVSGDGNIARLHIIDTTKPNAGEITLYSSEVTCDSECNYKNNWYIASASTRLSAFNRYSKIIDEGTGLETYVLDADGDYIFYGEYGQEDVYVTIESLRDASKITTVDYIDYVDTSDKKYSAFAIEHYAWVSNPGGVYLTITGGSDNSYTVDGDSSSSQWNYNYSISDGSYWIDYDISNGMSGYSALKADGYRPIEAMTIDMGVNKIVSSSDVVYTISYDVCYVTNGSCAEIEILNKVEIDDEEYSFGENSINNRSFAFNEAVCSINKLSTLVTCQVDGEQKTFPLYGNTFTYVVGATTAVYTITDTALLTVAGNYVTDIVGETVIINGVSYRFDRSAMLLHRDYVASIGITNNETRETPLTIDGTIYYIDTTTNSFVYRGETINISNYSFEIDGRVYKYVESVSPNDYYLYSESYPVYQDTFKVGNSEYNISNFDANNKYTIGNNVLKLSVATPYTDSYTLYDSKLYALTNAYTDGTGTNYEMHQLTYRQRILANVKWNYADEDVGSVNQELSQYLNLEADTIYKKHIKTAYLDTTNPEIGIKMTALISGTNHNVIYGDAWYVHEYGYYNTMELTQDKRYRLNGIDYTISIDASNMNNSLVVGVDENDEEFEYPIALTGLEDVSRKYVYTIGYTDFYIDENVTGIKWLYNYVDDFVGVKDVAKNENLNKSEVATESAMYNFNNSVFYGGITEHTLGQTDILYTNSNITQHAGLASNEYKLGGSDELFDFVPVTGRAGVYHEDIDYIVWYYTYDRLNNRVKTKVELNEEFKACHLAYGSVTRDCAQEAIETVINPTGLTGDIVYTINYVVRDKAGNASVYEARGVLYATIHPATNVIVNNVVGEANNSGVSVASLGNNTYSLTANQGVSLNMLQEAFSINYSNYKSSFNSGAVMTIYKDGELYKENVSGVDYTSYIDGSEIGDYTVVYNMSSVYTTASGERVDVNGETVTLHISITSPHLDIESDLQVEDIIKNESNMVFIFMIIGFVSIMAIGVIIFVKKKR